MSITQYLDALCGVCIDIMEYAEAYTGISYGTINVLLFIILGPASTLAFAAATIVSNTRCKHKTAIVAGLSIIGILCILPIFFLTIMAILNT